MGQYMSGEPNLVAVGRVSRGLIGVVGYDPASFGARFLHDANPSTQEQAWRRVTAHEVGAFATPTSLAGYKGVTNSIPFVTAIAVAMIIVQAADAIVGTQIHNRIKTIGPAVIGAINLVLLIWLLAT